MLKRSIRLSATPKPTAGRARGELNLRQSPLMRWAAAHVGRGEEASVFQQVAAAASEEIQAHDGSLSASNQD